jgi:hypothetical protein
MEPGQIRVVRAEGETWYEHVDGPHFRNERGKGLIQAVEGHAPAQALATKSRKLKLSGAILRIVAGSASVGGFLAWATTRHLDDQRVANQTIFSLLGVGVALGITGGVLAALGEKKKWRAIDSFNTWVLKDGSGFRSIPTGPGASVEEAESAIEPGPRPAPADPQDAHESEVESDEIAGLSLHPRDSSG